MPKVALVDVDDTLAATQTKILSYINTRSQREFRWNELNRDFREGGGVNSYEQLVQDFLSQPRLVLEIEPYPKAYNAVRTLFEAGHSLYIASSRKEHLNEITRQWLQQHRFSHYIEAVHPCFSGQRGSDFKVEVAKQVGADIAFDDTLSVAEVLAKTGVTTYLIDKPWNRQDDLPAGVIRVADIAEAVNLYCLGRV